MFDICKNLAFIVVSKRKVNYVLFDVAFLAQILIYVVYFMNKVLFKT